jgi:hypothetical protein
MELPAMEQRKPSTEEAFRESLKDVHAILIKLSVYCETLEELENMIAVSLANENGPGNNGQLRLLMDTITRPKRDR